MRHTVFLFGEAEKGEFCTPLVCKSLSQLMDLFGHPPEESQGLNYAVQALLFERELIYFRVAEEGFSVADYRRGLHLLSQRDLFYNLAAVAAPGLGDAPLIQEMGSVCSAYKSLLIVNDRDLYDFLTA
jgi:hypothetical protein